MPTKTSIGAGVNPAQLAAIECVRNGRTNAQIIHEALAQVIPGYQITRNGGDRRSPDWREKQQLVSANTQTAIIKIHVHCMDKVSHPDLPFEQNWYWSIESHDQDGYEDFNTGDDLTDWYQDVKAAYRAALTWLLQNEF